MLQAPSILQFCDVGFVHFNPCLHHLTHFPLILAGCSLIMSLNRCFGPQSAAGRMRTQISEYLGNEMVATSQHPFFIFFRGVCSLQEFHSLELAVFSALLSEMIV